MRQDKDHPDLPLFVVSQDLMLNRITLSVLVQKWTPRCDCWGSPAILTTIQSPLPSRSFWSMAASAAWP